MAAFPDKAWCQDIHQRILDGDPIAPAELCKAILAPLRGWLQRKGRTTNEEIVDNAATDAVVEYLCRPGRWSPAKATLVSYLCMAADRDLLNAVSKFNLRAKREISSEDVEVDDLPGNEGVEDQQRALAPEKLIAELRKRIPSESDREIVQLMMEGERSTERFATILGIQKLPTREKARVVKQHKDRLKKVVERLGSKLHGRR